MWYETQKKKKRRWTKTKPRLGQRKHPSRITDAQLKRHYRDPDQPGSLGGVARFAKAQGITVQRARRILEHDLGYTLHKPTRRHFPTLRVKVYGPDEQWAADLVDVQNIKRQNKGVHYLLTIIDVFSKYAWVRPIKKKTGMEVTSALKHVLEQSGRKPHTLQTDDGKEFYNKHVSNLLKEDGIRHFSTAGDTKASVVERFNHTFKQRLYRYMTTFNTVKYLSKLQALVHGYNVSHHRSIGIAPIKVTVDNARQVWNRLYKVKKKKPKKETLKVGDKVRLNKKHRTFDKGYRAGWTEEVFSITQILRGGNVTVYKIAEWDDTPIKGTFYAQDLQKVQASDDDLFRIEKVLRRKKDRVLVRWQGWPPKYDAWIHKKDLVNLQPSS